MPLVLLTHAVSTPVTLSTRNAWFSAPARELLVEPAPEQRRRAGRNGDIKRECPQHDIPYAVIAVCDGVGVT